MRQELKELTDEPIDLPGKVGGRFGFFYEVTGKLTIEVVLLHCS